MQLRSLRVKNIRSYESGALDFAPGTTLLVGDVGSGKTSLLYAIEMALFGVAEVDAAFLIRHGGGRAEVVVGFEDDDHRYEVRRGFRRVRRRGRETFEPEKIGLRVDGAETAYSATELRQRVIELLGFPDNPNPQAHSDLWRWAVYVPQERMRDILGGRPQDRLETVRKALGVERYRIAADNAAELATDLRRSATARRGEADRLRHFDAEFADGTAESDRWRAQRADLEASIQRREETATRARAAVAERSDALRRTDGDRRELESLDWEQSSAQQSIADREAAQRARQQERAALTAESGDRRPRESAVVALQLRLAKSEEEATAAGHAREVLSERLRELSSVRTALEAQLAAQVEATGAVDRGRLELAAASRELEAARAERPVREPPAPTPDSIATLDSGLQRARQLEADTLTRLTQSRSELAELDALLAGGICPRCRQSVRPADFSAHRQESATSVERASSVHTAAVGAREALEDARRARERYERAHDRWTELERRRAAAAGAVERLAASVAADEARRENAGRTVDETRSRVASLESVERDARSVKEAAALADEVRRTVAKELEVAIVSVERARAAEAGRLRLDEELARLEAELERERARRDERSRRRDELVERLTGTEALAAALVEAEAVVRTAESELAEDRAALVRTETRLDESARRIAAAARGRADRAALLAEADDIERKAAWAGRAFRDALLEMEKRLLAHAQSEFERHFARYFASLVDDPALVATTDPAFTPAVLLAGEWTPADALSGGERTSLALAFRLALARVVRSLGNLRLDTLLLDEPTDGFSPEQVTRMGELLDELALPQVILVSHEAQLAAVADRVVRVSKVDGRSVLELPDPRTPAPTAEAEPVASDVTPGRR